MRRRGGRATLQESEPESLCRSSKKRKVATADAYSEAKYWDERYKSAKGYHNWYYTFSDLQPIFAGILLEQGVTLHSARVLRRTNTPRRTSLSIPCFPC